ncbi:hypothetical protein WKW80_34745 [Variovorax humicola]|uniref:Uncharacterized protein n=1 Tax=Variovorax humicola TaxID=1769758 RepID=A0ABU8WAM1_9BURK
MKPVQDVLGPRMQECAKLSHCVAAIRQERDVLAGQDALRLKY